MLVCEKTAAPGALELQRPYQSHTCFPTKAIKLLSAVTIHWPVLFLLVVYQAGLEAVFGSQRYVAVIVFFCCFL